MGRKPGTEKEFRCLDCFNCKTRTFTTPTQIRDWCKGWSIKPNQVWINDVVELGFIRLLWCPLQTDRHCSHGFSPRNASPRYSANIIDVLESEKDVVVVTNHNKKTFIPDCPFRVT